MVETVILGNDAIMKCSVPSFISDIVSIKAWVDSEGNDFRPRQSFNGNDVDLHRCILRH